MIRKQWNNKMENIKLIVWDFDETLTKEHSKKNDDILGNLSDKNWPLLVRQLVKNNYYVGIASFNKSSIIKEYINKWIPDNNPFDDFNIQGNDGYIGSKTQLISKIMEHFNIDRYDQVIFFDDNFKNILETRSYGINSFLVEKPGFSIHRDWNCIINILK